MYKNKKECLGTKFIKDGEVKCSVEMRKEKLSISFKETSLLKWTPVNFEHWVLEAMLSKKI